jgi:hypothetical protein
MTLITVSTVGCFEVHTLCRAGRIFNISSFCSAWTGVPFVVMDRSEARAERATAAGMNVLVADSTR